MTRFLARRLVNYVVLLALASFLTFCLTSVAFSPLESLMQRSPRPPQAVIDAKVEGREVVQAEDAQPSSGTVVDLMAALRASVEAATKGGTSSSAASGDEAEPKKASKKAAKGAPAKKAAAKKTSSKSSAKTPAKKAAARKSA